MASHAPVHVRGAKPCFVMRTPQRGRLPVRRAVHAVVHEEAILLWTNHQLFHIQLVSASSWIWRLRDGLVAVIERVWRLRDGLVAVIE